MSVMRRMPLHEAEDLASRVQGYGYRWVRVAPRANGGYIVAAITPSVETPSGTCPGHDRIFWNTEDAEQKGIT